MMMMMMMTGSRRDSRESVGRGTCVFASAELDFAPRARLPCLEFWPHRAGQDTVASGHRVDICQRNARGPDASRNAWRPNEIADEPAHARSRGFSGPAEARLFSISRQVRRVRWQGHRRHASAQPTSPARAAPPSALEAAPQHCRACSDARTPGDGGDSWRGQPPSAPAVPLVAAGARGRGNGSAGGAADSRESSRRSGDRPPRA